jgi:hypothetical protein
MTTKNKIQEFLTKELLPFFNKENHSFTPHVQEEFMDLVGGYLDSGYVAKLAEHAVSRKVFRLDCIAVFGVDYFNRMPLPEETLTRETFDKEYEFGKYTHCRQWISHFKDFATRQTVLGYVYDSKPVSTRFRKRYDSNDF